MGVALADDLTAASAGTNLASLMEVPDAFLERVRARAQVKGTALIPLIDSMLPRLSDGVVEGLPDLFPGVPGDRLLAGKSAAVPPYLLNLVELADRLMITPRQRARLPVSPSDVQDLSGLSRYEAELAVHVRNEWEPRWLPDLLFAHHGEGDSAWHQFLLSPAAAPTLRAAVRCLDRTICADLADVLAMRFADEAFKTFDVDTAAAFAVLSWRGGQACLC